MSLLTIIPDHATFGTRLFATFMTLLLIIYVLRVQKYPHKLSKSESITALFLCLMVLLFPMSAGDYFDYKEWVEHANTKNLDSLSLYEEHYEKVYWYIVAFVHNNYLLFRLIVWGGALFIVYRSAKHLDLDRGIFIYYLAILLTINLSTSRVILAMAIAFLGFAHIIRPPQKTGRKLLSYILGCALIISSIFFHRSAMFVLAVLPLSLLKIDRRTIWILLILFPVIVGFVNTNMFSFLMNADSYSLLDADTAMYYVEYHKREMGIGRLFSSMLYYTPIVLFIMMIVKNMLNGKFNSWPSHIQKCANSALIFMLISAVFLFSSDNQTFKIFERLTAFVFIPMTFTLTFIFKNRGDMKMLRYVNQLSILYGFYNTLYYTLYLH